MKKVYKLIILIVIFSIVMVIILMYSPTTMILRGSISPKSPSPMVIPVRP